MEFMHKCEGIAQRLSIQASTELSSEVSPWLADSSEGIQ